MLEHDRSNFVQLLRSFPEHITTSRKIMAENPVKISTRGLRNIVIAGMGGSAISGELLLGYAGEELPVPAVVNRGYNAPGFVDKNTLFVAMSYSGNTEETLSATREALQRGAQVVAITSGGELAGLSREKGLPLVEIPGGLPPRQALGYMFYPLLMLFNQNKLVNVSEADLDEARQVAEDQLHRYDPDHTQGHCLPNHIAQSVYHAIPVIYSGASFLAGMPTRWRNQFSENSKCMAFGNVFPELNHNEIMGWEGLYEVNKHFRAIFLRDEEETPRNKKRIEVTKGILRQNKILFGEIYSEGRSRLARLTSMVVIGDWASFYGAMLHSKDPIEIGSIDKLKAELSKV